MEMSCKLTDKNMTSMISDGTLDADLGIVCPMGMPNVKEEPADENVSKVKDALAEMKFAYLNFLLVLQSKF